MATHTMAQSNAVPTQAELVAQLESLGGKLIANFVSQDEHDAQLKFLEAQPWDAEQAPGKRDVQQYGHKYLYRNGSQAPPQTTPIPEQLNVIRQRLVERKLAPKLPDQCIVNAYDPGQGIAPHIDHPKHFGSPIVSVTLGSGVAMRLDGCGMCGDLYLPVRSALVLDGKSRSHVQHSIDRRQTDTVDGVQVPRGRRLGVTFRIMLK